MRADAQRNRERLIEAAISIALERGGDPTRDAVAQRAGVGIGTLYRHFPDQQSLLRAVALHVLDRTIEAGNTFLAEETDALMALRRYMHAAIDSGLGVLNLSYPFLENHDWPERRTAAETIIDTLIARAAAQGRLRIDATRTDIALAIIRFSRPLGIGRSLDEERAVAHRHLDTYLDGLSAQAGHSPLRLEGRRGRRLG